MASPVLFLIFFIFWSRFCVPVNSQSQSSEEGFTTVSISDKGLDFVKDLLIDRAVSALTPLNLPDIDKYVQAPVVGRVHVVLSDIVIYHIDFPSSFVKSGEDGVVIAASGATGNLSMSWRYSYKPWFVPIEVTDSGEASVQVEGMEVGILAIMKSHEGKLQLSLLECGCSVEDIFIKLDGGASWLYQGVVDAFGNKIESAIEDAIAKKIDQGISKMDSLLQSLPQDIRVDDISSLNVSFVGDPTFGDSSVDFEINGLFIATENVIGSEHEHEHHNGKTRALDSYQHSSKMVAISLHEDVFNSASLIYFNAGAMQWTVTKLPGLSILNTKEWRDVVPRLYEQFPDDDMSLNVSATSPPVIKVGHDQVDTIIFSDMTIDVLGDGEAATSVACISLVITASGSVAMSGNNLTGSINLESISLSPKWSNIGDLPLQLVQPVISAVFDDVLLPLLNSHLRNGFALPLIRGIELQNPEIVLTESRITVGSDAAFVENRGSLKLSDVMSMAVDS